MKLTVIICDAGDAAHVGGPLQYRRVTVDLSREQAEALALRHGYETYGTTFIEPPPSPRGTGTEGT